MIQILSNKQVLTELANERARNSRVYWRGWLRGYGWGVATGMIFAGGLWLLSVILAKQSVIVKIANAILFWR